MRLNPARLPEFLGELGFPSKTKLKSRWTEVNGLRLHTRSAVNGRGGQPFVLIHGLVISSLYMIPLGDALAIHGDVHALDLPGFGRSEAPREIRSVPQLAATVVDWLSAHEIKQCHLVANSLGCEIAAHVAIIAPDRVASLALVGPTLDPHAFAVATQTLRLLQDALQEPARLWANWIFDFFRAGPRRAFGTTREMFRDHIERQLPSVHANTLIMRGSKDPTVPQRAAEEMARLTPASTLVVFENEPHCVHYTNPQIVCDVIVRHVRDTTK